MIIIIRLIIFFLVYFLNLGLISQNIDENSNISREPNESINSKTKTNELKNELFLHIGRFNGTFEPSNISNFHILETRRIYQDLDKRDIQTSSPLGLKFFLNTPGIKNRIMFGLERFNFNKNNRHLDIVGPFSSETLYPAYSSIDNKIALNDFFLGYELKSSEGLVLIPKFTLRQFSNHYSDGRFYSIPSSDGQFYTNSSAQRFSSGSYEDTTNAGILGLMGSYKIIEKIKFLFDVNLPLEMLNVLPAKKIRTDYISGELDKYTYTFSSTNSFSNYINSTAQIGLNSYDLKLDLSRSNKIKLGLDFQINEIASIELSYYQENIALQKSNIKMNEFYIYNNTSISNFLGPTRIENTSNITPNINRSALAQLLYNSNQNIFIQGYILQLNLKVF